MYYSSDIFLQRGYVPTCGDSMWEMRYVCSQVSSQSSFAFFPNTLSWLPEYVAVPEERTEYNPG